MSDARAMWVLFEPVYAVTNFDERCRDRFLAAGLRGFWRQYFAGRAAPLGAVGAAPVIASFFSFAPALVTRAIPDVWTLATPAEAIRARSEGAAQALTVLLADLPVAGVTEAAELLEAGVAALEPGGRVLGAANAAIAVGPDPYARLFQAATTLREHRGDGHIAALVALDLGPLEAVALRCGLDLSREYLQPGRGWTDEEWSAATVRLVGRGLLDASGRATAAGADLVATAEDWTDRAAQAPWTALGPAAVGRLAELLAPIAARCRSVPGIETAARMTGIAFPT